jgi:acyl-coenzyme A thioesterase PaaI-like protein
MRDVRGMGRARFAQCSATGTNADGTRVAKTLTQLGITEIDLRPDTTQVALPDGSRITGQASFVIGGARRTAADMVLMTQGCSNHLEQSYVLK